MAGWKALAVLVLGAAIGACTPKTYDECIGAAAKMPTEIGVKTARSQCDATFSAEVEARAAAKAKAAQEKIDRWVASWQAVGELENEAQIKEALGPPSYVQGPQPCEAGKDPKEVGVCMQLQWTDPRKGRVCSSIAGCLFRANVYAANEGERAGALRTWSRESY